jgi:hypothetical protein
MIAAQQAEEMWLMSKDLNTQVFVAEVGRNIRLWEILLSGFDAGGAVSFFAFAYFSAVLEWEHWVGYFGRICLVSVIIGSPGSKM